MKVTAPRFFLLHVAELQGHALMLHADFCLNLTRLPFIESSENSHKWLTNGRQMGVHNENHDTHV